MSTGFHTLAITDVRRETGNAITVRFAVPDALVGQFRFHPGQHLTLRADIGGEDLRRSYSICSTPNEAEPRVAIKRVDGGRFSNWANDALHKGATLEVMPPAGAFTWHFEPDRQAQYAMFASGSGITPILSLLKSGLEAEPRSRFALFYGNRESSSVLFSEEIAQLKNSCMDRLEIHHFLSREDDEFEILNGRIDSRKMEDILARFLPAGAIDTAFVCGPAAMMEAVEASLIKAGLDENRIKSERFTAGELSEERREVVEQLEKQAAGRSIRITINGKRRTVIYDPALESILENSRAAGLPAPFACKAGVCATCRAKVLRGKVEMIRHFGLSDEEIERGYVLTCQSIPMSDDVEIDFDA
ncbi:MAG: 2Fe-2S iron-sulfur cluster-binding protein [Myxococcota bacterium]|jgi:ring-1,2-phenylacetyl-CoA epoxidase subunit PaaE